jgi:putative DNA primase/helicase
MRPEIVRAIRELLTAGVSCVPIKPDGSKAPLVPWHGYQRQRATLAELSGWITRFRGVDAGLAIVTGRASSNVEVLDFDTLALIPEWEAMVEDLCPGLLARLVIVLTPRPGRHVYYRSAVIEGNQKLAQALDTDGKPTTLIETRGLGGYAIIPPSPPACHPQNTPYVLLQGDLAQIPEITPEAREVLLNCGRTFSSYINPAKVVSGYTVKATMATPAGDRPGDIFAAAVSWAELLEHHGWRLAGSRGELLFWCRPGKSKGHSATTGLGQTDLLHVFSTNAHPFEADTCYTRFAAYAVLEHGGDFHKAAALLAIKGYRRPRPREHLPPLVDPWLGPKWKVHGIPGTKTAGVIS